VQLLYLNSRILAQMFSSINDEGGPANVANAVGNGGTAYYHDGYLYDGAMYAPVDPSNIRPVYFPYSSGGRPFESVAANDGRDYNDNGVVITKLQYQRNFDPKSYLRLFGYTEYSNWFEGGPGNSQFTGYYGGYLNIYDLPSHTYGFNANYSNQLSDKHLLGLTASYTSARVSRRFTYGYPGNTVGYGFTSLVDAQGYCYDASTHAQTSCFTGTRGTFPTTPPGTPASSSYVLPTGTVDVVNPSGAPTTATWLATDAGYVNTRLNQVSPAFAAGAITDQYRPNDRLTFTLGARFESFDDRLGDTTGSPARQFWFNAYNNEHCYKPGALGVRQFPVGPTASGPGYAGATPALCAAAFGPGYTQADLVNLTAPHVTSSVFEPRFGLTYSVSPDTVLRGSFGIYARPVNTSWLQYDAVNQDLASFIGANFLSLGYNTPIHTLRPDTSTNVDFSLEQHFHGSDVSFKLSPFYRATRNQLQPVPIGAGGVVSGFNVGQQTSSGIEFALKKGDFGRDGLAVQLAYTYTRSRIKYGNFHSGTNIIDGINQYIQEYNGYTSACASITAANANLCGLTPGTANANAAPTFAAVDPAKNATTIANPYYAQPAQPLLDRNAAYTTYDQIPQPFTGENGYETPHVASLIVSYKHARFTVTPSLTFSSGAEYGSPLAYPGYIPVGCTTVGAVGTSGGTIVDPKTCTATAATSGLPFLLVPDAYTGRFDNLGAFNEPERLTLNLAGSYDATKNVRLSFALTGLVDSCFQRGYAWDDPRICVYSQLPSGGNAVGPSGNFIPLAKTPIQYRYPYGVFNNNLNTGFIGTNLPLQATLDVQFRL